MHGPSDADERRARETASRLGLPYADARTLTIDARALTTLSEASIDRCRAMPIELSQRRLRVATANPSDLTTLDDVARLSGHPITPVVVSHSGLQWLIERHRRSSPDLSALDSAIDTPEPETPGAASNDDHAVIQTVERILRDAIASGASDIHLEPTRSQLNVRLRIDGQLQTRHQLPRSSAEAITARIKHQANLDISERRRPQDGRFRTGHDNQTVDLRVASLPTHHGEKLVLRILPRAENVPELHELALHPGTESALDALIQRPHGMILITGPTGSGKTLTTYAILKRLAIPQRHIITVEDPIEIELPGIVQTQTNPKAGYDFPNALRALLRTDPDIIAIGEIRDRETAQLAIEAALTGHTLLGTTHTQNAPSAVVRLIELGVEPFKLSAALQGVLAQRLVRRVCRHCAEPVVASDPELRWFAAAGIDPEHVRPQRGRGCSGCDQRGTAGRMAIHELLVADPTLLQAVANGEPLARLRTIAEGGGMRSLQRDAAEKAAAGLIPSSEAIAAVDSLAPHPTR
jgi:type IV pilus assembly protein PilB